jgi:antitoxin HicB
MSEQKDLKYYLSLPYTVQLTREDEETWFARVVELPGCMTEGDSAQEAAEMILDAMTGWIEIALEDGRAIPEPRPTEGYSGKFVVRLPRSLHRELVQAAEREGVSLNSFVNASLGRAVGQPPTRKPEKTSVGDARPAWPRLSEAARKAMLDAGCDVEAQEINEQLVANWVERNIENVQATLAGGNFQDAAARLERHLAELQSVGEASPLMGVFCRALSLLHDQAEQNAQLRAELRAGLVNQALNQEQLILARVSAQTQATFPVREPREETYSTFGQERMDQFKEDMLKKMGMR